MSDSFLRTELLLGTDALEKLSSSKVSIFGIGGVGSFTVEALARSGVGRFVLIDDDTICSSNINRQIHANHKTIGKPKVEVMRDRILEINPEADIKIYREFYNSENAENLIGDDSDYIVDAIDTVSSKIDLIVRAKEKGISIISSMGAGNKLDPTRFEVTDIYKTSIDPLSKVMRRELRRRGVQSLKVVFSKEEPIKPIYPNDDNQNPIEQNPYKSKRQIPGSVAWVPPVVGLIIGGEVVKDLVGRKDVK